MVDLDKIVESVVADLLPEAAARDIDLGFALADREDKPPAVVICGDTHAWLAANVLGMSYGTYYLYILDITSILLFA